MKSPLILGTFCDELSLQSAVQLLQQKFSLFTHKIIKEDETLILSAYFFSEDIKMNDIRKNIKNIVINPKGITKQPSMISKLSYDHCLFSEGELNEITQQHLVITRNKSIKYFKLVGPNVIFTVKNKQNCDDFEMYLKDFKNLLIYRRLEDESNIYMSIIYCQDVLTIGELKAGVQAKCYQAKENINKEPFFLDFAAFKRLCFTEEEQNMITSSNQNEKQKLQILQNGKRTPRILFKVKDINIGLAIYQDLCTLYSRQLLLVQYLVVGDQFYIAAYHHPNVNLNAMYYTLKMPVNRYVHINFDIRKPPFFIEDNIFYSLLFEEEACQQVLNYEISTDNTILPKIIIMNLTLTQCEQLQKILTNLFANRLLTSEITSKHGACYIGILFIEKHMPGKRVTDFLSDYGCEFCQQKAEGFKERAQFLLDKLSFNEQQVSFLETKKSSKHEKQELEQSPLSINLGKYTNQKCLVFIDFEAFLYRHDIAIASEFAAVIVQNNQIVDEFHSLIRPSTTEIAILQNEKYQQIVKNTQALTGIDSFNPNSPTLNEVITQFTAKLSNFTDYILVAKAPQLELILLNQVNSPLAFNVCDYSDIKTDGIFKSAHSLNREKFYCTHHKSVGQIGLYGQAVHCALDDCYFLAKIYLSETIPESKFFGVFVNHFTDSVIVEKSDDMFVTKHPGLIAPKFIFSCSPSDFPEIIQDFERIFACKYRVKSVIQNGEQLNSMLFVQSDVPPYCTKLFVKGKETRFFNFHCEVPAELMFTQEDFLAVQ